MQAVLWRPEVWWVTLGFDVECWWLVSLAGWILSGGGDLLAGSPQLSKLPPAAAARLGGGWGQQGDKGTGNRSGNASEDVTCGVGCSLPLLSVPPAVTPLKHPPPSPEPEATQVSLNLPWPPALCIYSDNDFYTHTFMFSLTLFSCLSLILLLLLHFWCPYKFYLSCIWD